MCLVGQLELPTWKQPAALCNGHKIHKYDAEAYEHHNLGIHHYESMSEHDAHGAYLYETLMFFSLEQPFF